MSNDEILQQSFISDNLYVPESKSINFESALDVEIKDKDEPGYIIKAKPHITQKLKEKSKRGPGRPRKLPVKEPKKKLAIWLIFLIIYL